MKKFILKLTRNLRQHNWEVDSEWVKEGGVVLSEKMLLPMTRLFCSRCGDVTPPFNITDKTNFSYFHNLRGCCGYKEDEKGL